MRVSLLAPVMTALVACGCSDGASRLPTSGAPGAPSPPSPGAPLTAFRVGGTVVDEENKPVEGVDVRLTGASRSFITEDAGRYLLETTARQSVYYADVIASKAGFEPSRYPVNLYPSSEALRNVRLHPIVGADAEGSIRLGVDAADPTCGFERYTCRRVRIRARSAGTLILSVASDGANDQFTLALADQDPQFMSSLVVTVAAGSETSVDVLVMRADGSGPHVFTLTSSLKP